MWVWFIIHTYLVAGHIAYLLQNSINTSVISKLQVVMYNHAAWWLIMMCEAPSYIYTVEPVYYGHLETTHKCTDYQVVLIFQVSLYDKAPFGTITKCVDYVGVLIIKCPD